MPQTWFDPLGFGRRLQQARGALSQRELGERLGYLQPHISRYERGAIPASFRFLAGLSALFDVDLNWLLTGRRPAGRGAYLTEAALTGAVRAAVIEALRGATAPAGSGPEMLPGTVHPGVTETVAAAGLGLPASWDRLMVELPRLLGRLLVRTEPVYVRPAPVDVGLTTAGRTSPAEAEPSTPGPERADPERQDADQSLDDLLRVLRECASGADPSLAVERLAAAADGLERALAPPLGLERARLLILWAWLIAVTAAERREGPPERAAELLFRLARSTRKCGRLEEAEDLYIAARAAAEQAGAPALAARCGAGLGHVRFARGDFERARSEYVGVLETALSLGSPELLFFAHLDLASYYHEHEERYDKAMEYARAGLELARREQDLEHVSLFLNEIGLNESEMGDAPAAEASFVEAVAIAERLGNQVLLASFTINRAGARLRSGDPEGAWELLREGRDMAAQAGLSGAECRAEILLARCEHARMRTGAALERLERVEDRCSAQGLVHERELARALEREIRQGMLGRLEALTA